MEATGMMKGELGRSPNLPSASGGTSSELRAEVFAIGRAALPVAGTYLLSYVNQLVSQYAVGHTSSQHLAAAALGTMYANAFGFSLILGVSSALDTLASQAVGAGNLRRVADVAKRGLAVTTVLSVPVAISFYFSGLLFTHLGQDPVTAALAGVYTRFLILSLPAVLVFDLLRKQLLAVGDMYPPAACTALSILINAGMSPALVFHTPLNFLGAPIGAAIAQWVSLGLLVFYVRQHRRVRAVGRMLRRMLFASLDCCCCSGGGGSGGGGSGCCGRRSRHHVRLGESAAVEGCAAAESEHAAADPASSANAAGDAVEKSGDAAGGESPSGDAAGEESPLDSGSPPPPATEEAEEAVLSHAPAVKGLSQDDMIDAAFVGETGWRGAFTGWLEYLSLGIPGAAMLFVEWASYEFSSIIAGQHSTATLAGHTIIAATASLSFMFVLGISVNAAYRVGQRMGDRRPDSAKTTYRAALICWVVLVTLNAAVVLTARHAWARTFTDDPVVVALVDRWLPLVALYTVTDAGQGVCSGVLRGIGRPFLAAIANVISYCVIALPLAYYFCIAQGMGLPGIWIGFVAGVTTSFLLLLAILACLDWEKEAQVAHSRATRDVAAAPGGALSLSAPGASASSGAVGGGGDSGVIARGGCERSPREHREQARRGSESGIALVSLAPPSDDGGRGRAAADAGADEDEEKGIAGLRRASTRGVDRQPGVL